TQKGLQVKSVRELSSPDITVTPLNPAVNEVHSN
ncbi:MAG TPA: cold shock domain-containing protein, partial [Chlorobaculum parvum]|nr:cold shock domain-containing protein [Chlorobaculum parvum]